MSRDVSYLMKNNLAYLMKLKEVYRKTLVPFTGEVVEVDGVKYRSESDADHVTGCQILVEYFLPREKTKHKTLDELLIKDMLVYHDDGEIILGDKYFLDVTAEDKAKELKAIYHLSGILPEPFASKIVGLYTEFDANETINAKFANAIDKLEPAIQLLNVPHVWIERKFSLSQLRAHILACLNLLIITGKICCNI